MEERQNETRIESGAHINTDKGISTGGTDRKSMKTVSLRPPYLKVVGISPLSGGPM